MPIVLPVFTGILQARSHVTKEETEAERGHATGTPRCTPGSCEDRCVVFRLQSPDSFMPSWWGGEGRGRGGRAGGPSRGRSKQGREQMPATGLAGGQRRG